MTEVGAATDACWPCGDRYRVNRRALEAVVGFRAPVGVAPTSALMVSDANLRANLHWAAGASVYFTITPLGLKRRIEPGTLSPANRLATREWLAPRSRRRREIVEDRVRPRGYSTRLTNVPSPSAVASTRSPGCR